MIIHADLNRKPTKKGVKSLRVEFFNNGGYWAKWYIVQNSKEAKAAFQTEYPNGLYYRSKNY